MAVAIFIIGILVNAVGGIMLLVRAFRESALWGLACIFIPFASLFFLIKFWPETKQAFLISLGGTAIMLLGVLGIAGSAEPTDNTTMAAAEESADEEPEPERRSEPEYEASAMPQPATASVEYVPPHPPTIVNNATEEKPKRIEQVYVDRDNGVYFTEDCKKRPEAAIRMAKTVAKMQGYAAAPCPR